MNTDLITAAAHATIHAEKPFPQIVGMLIEAGVEFYHVDYLALRKTFYSGEGAFVSVPIPLEGLPPVAADFDAEALRGNILDSQQNHQTWRDFTLRAMRGGVQGYFAFLRGQRVTYFGRQGDQHTEWFPGVKPAAEMIPPLYKFRVINDYTLDELQKSYVYFSNMTTLNDPFEMGVYLDQASSLEAARVEFMKTDYSESPIGKVLEGMSEDRRKAYLDARWNCDEWREPFLKAWRKVDGYGEDMKKRVSIYCASATRTDGLLWAHYASGHRGIAIELNSNVDPVLRNARKVEYQKEFPVIDMLRDSTDTKFIKSMLTKSINWCYEQEYRALFPCERENVKHEVAPSTFITITFGAKITDTDRNKVIKATRTRLSHVRFEQARLGRQALSVEFHDFEHVI